MTHPPTGVATGIGSLPGEDSRTAAAQVIDLLPELPHIPELPDRGPWAQMAGRALGVLVDLPAEWDGRAWRTTSRDGRDVRRARSLLAEDLDAVEDRWQGYIGPAKLQMCGPLTLAAQLELRGGTAVVADASARADVAVSLAEGLAGHVRELSQRVPGAEWVVQIDEPAATAVTTGVIPRASGWGTISALTQREAGELLTTVVDRLRSLGVPMSVHSCANEPDWPLMTSCFGQTPAAISVDLDAIDLEQATPIMEAWLDEGGSLWLGIDPLADAGTGHDLAIARLETLRSAVGLDAERFAQAIVVTPRCGLTGAPDVVAASYAGVRQLMRRLRG